MGGVLCALCGLDRVRPELGYVAADDDGPLVIGEQELEGGQELLGESLAAGNEARRPVAEQGLQGHALLGTLGGVVHQVERPGSGPVELVELVLQEGAV